MNITWGSIRDFMETVLLQTITGNVNDMKLLKHNALPSVMWNDDGSNELIVLNIL